MPETPKSKKASDTNIKYDMRGVYADGKNPIYMPREYLPQSYGGVYIEGSGGQGRAERGI